VIPVHELLARIRWDPQFGGGRFELGYLDRKEKPIVRIPPERITITPDQHFTFEAVEDDGSVPSVP